MRVVAGSTILCNGCMLPKIGPTGFRMTFVAGVVEGLANEQPILSLAVRAMAIATTHRALADRMRKRLHRLSALLLMTVKADFSLCRGRQDRIAGRVAGVTVGTGNIVDVVAAAMPGEPGIGCVAIHAKTVLLNNRSDRFGAKRKYRGALLAATYPARMVTTRAMASLALQLAVPERGIRVTGYRVVTPKHSQRRLVVMARKTGIRTLTTVVGVLCASRTGGQNS